jgi:hypothetical protein
MGGLMLGSLRTLAYGNIVSGNISMHNTVPPGTPTQDLAAIRFVNLYGNVMSYNNKYINNTVIGGNLYFNNQSNFVIEGNTLRNTVTRVEWVP